LIVVSELSAASKPLHASTLRDLQNTLVSAQFYKRQLDTAQKPRFAALMVCCSVITSADMMAAIAKKYVYVMYTLLENYSQVPDNFLEVYDHSLLQLSITVEHYPVVLLAASIRCSASASRCSLTPRQCPMRPAGGCSLTCWRSARLVPDR
jgi:hypothetical protein